MKAEAIVKKLLEYGLAIDEPGVLDAARCFADEIAEAHKAEIAVWESACDRWNKAKKEWKMTEGVLKAALDAREEVWAADLATAQAQVAVMAEAIKRAKKWLADNDAALLDARIAHVLLYDVLRDALSAAPKVVWSGEAKLGESPHGEPRMVFPHDSGYDILEAACKSLYDEKDWRIATVIVLDKQGEGE